MSFERSFSFVTLFLLNFAKMSTAAIKPLPSLPSLPRPTLEVEWEKLLAIYLKKGHEAFISPLNQKLQDELIRLFGILRKLNPTSYEPFYPFFTCLLGRLEQGQFEDILKQAKECNFALTYVLVVHMLHINMTGKDLAIISVPQQKNVIEMMRRAYPEDLFLPAFAQAVDAGAADISVDLSPVSSCLELTFATLLSGDFPAALRQLVLNNSLLPGHSILQRYMTLACVLSGNFKQAKIASERAAILFDFKNGFVSTYLEKLVGKFLKDIFSLPLPPLPAKRTYDVLGPLIEMCESIPLDPNKALKFVDEALNSLRTDHDQLPFIYFGFRHLTTHLCYDSSWQKLIPVLYDFSAAICEVCHTTGPVEAIPKFALIHPLVLHKASINSFANCITRQVFQLTMSLMDSAITNEGIRINISMPLITEPAAFRSFLESGLTRDETREGFYLSIDYLRSFYDLKERPALTKTFLEWAKFCIFTSEEPSFLSRRLDQEIEQRYYPANFSKKKYQANLAILSKQKRTLPLRLAVRDTMLACHDLSVRDQSDNTKTGMLYDLYKASKKLYGWRPEETLAAWTDRLQKLEQSNPLLNFFLNFWIRFQKSLWEKSSPIPVNFDVQKWITLIENAPLVSSREFSHQKEKPLLPVQKIPLLPCPEGDIPTIAASLIVNAESDDGVHTILMGTEEQSRQIFQILLEVSVDRLVRRAIVNMGDLELKDADVQSHLSNYLQLLIGAYGAGFYYKAHVVTSDYSLIKTRIVY